MALSALVFVPIMLLSTWGFLHSTDTSGELSRWYPGERSDILIAKASEARGSGDYVTMRALVLKALKQRPGDPYLWLSLGSVPAGDPILQLDALDRAHALAPGSSFVAEGIVTTCARLRSELPSAYCGRIDQMLKLTIGSQQETSARKLILLLGEQTGSFVAVQKILGPHMEQPVVCAAFDSGQRNLLLDWVRKNSGREALSRPVAARLMSLPKDTVWLRALEGSVDTVAAQHPELAMEYLKALAARGQTRTALLRADSAFRHQPVWLFISHITVMTSRDSLEHLAENMEKLALVTRGELSYFLAGWDNAARSEQWGTLSKALRSLQRFDGIPEVDLRLANALYNSGKLEDALALLERHRSRVDSNKALQEKLSDCYRRLGLVDKLRELEP